MLLHVPTLVAECHWVITAGCSPGIYGDSFGYFECFVVLQFNCILVPRILLMCIALPVCVWQAWEMCVAIHIIRASAEDISAAVQCSGTTVGPGTAAMNLPVDLRPWSLSSNHTCKNSLMHTRLVLTILVLCLSTVVLTGCLWHKLPEVHYMRLKLKLISIELC